MRPLAVVSCALLATSALIAGACSERVGFEPGEECELNTDCAAPLVCRLGRCRVECRAQRDCPAKLECVRDEDGLGACQIEAEAECMLTSDCPDFLVCRFGRCTNACEVDRDCAPGARCLEEPGGGRGCRDQAEIECEVNTDCMYPLICATDERCRPECREARDCRPGRVCAMELDTPVCVEESETDGGVGLDGGVMDAGDGGLGTDGGDGDGGAGTVTPPSPPTMAAGLLHTCVRADPSNSVHCWGDNLDAQIGTGTFDSPQPSPVAVGLTGISLVGAGAEHSCAASGSILQCWGLNDSGQLGIGSAGSPMHALAPTTVTGLTGEIQDLALGSDHTCALTSTKLYCWGANTYGQLGDGTFVDRPSPVAITVGGTPTAVATFGFHTCVRLASGQVQCFGQNDRGQLGLGDTTNRESPTTIAGITDAAQVSTGTGHTCVLHATGAIDCFGADTQGQLGDGATLADRNRPSPVVGLASPAREIALGSTHSCARTDDDVYCWGANFFGQVGVDPIALSALPIGVAIGAGPVEELEAGSTHTCFRSAAGHFCFGRNNQGQLGFGSTTPSSQHVPQMVAF